jgi:arylsulfatase A-like enzyme
MSNRQRKRAIVVVLDRLGAGFLGPYGNTWLDTPEFNRLANDGLLLEQAIVDTLDLPLQYESLWSGRHAAFPPSTSTSSLIAELTASGRPTRLLTDEPVVAEHALATAFDQVDRLPAPAADRLCDDPDETVMARLCATAVSQWLDASLDLLWIHGSALQAVWDAPYELREQFRDEEDPATPTEVIPPRGPVPDGIDPDVLQGWLWAYAAQVSLLDRCLEPICELWRQAAEPTLLIVTGSRGYALGEHGHWGDTGKVLHSERIQVPLLVASNDLQLARIRSQSLVQPADVAATLRDWFQLEGSEPSERPPRSLLRLVEERWDPHSAFARPLAVTHHDGHWALRTPAWLACLADADAQHGGLATCELYLKPDDRWDVSNVADRAEPVARGFLDLAQQIGEQPAGATVDDLLPLDPLLVEPPD